MTNTGQGDQQQALPSRRAARAVFQGEDDQPLMAGVHIAAMAEAMALGLKERALKKQLKDLGITADELLTSLPLID